MSIFAGSINQNYRQQLPEDLNKTIGGFNSLLIQGFSSVRAVSSEFFKITFGLHLNFFNEMDPIASKLSTEMKERLYKQSQISVFPPADTKTTNFEKPSQKDMKKNLGVINLALIDAFSNTRAFGRVFFKRLTTAFTGFSDEVKVKSKRFSVDTKMRVYNSVKSHQIQPQETKKHLSDRVQELDTPSNTKTKNQSQALTKGGSYKRTAIVVALLGVAVLLAYYVFPIFQLEMDKVNKALEIEFVTKRIFYIFNKTKIPEINCYDFQYPIIGGQPLQRTLNNSKFFRIIRRFYINCKNLTIRDCKEKCMSATKSVFWWFN